MVAERMFESRLARGLMILGAAVGMLTVAVVAVDVQVNLPDWMVQVAMAKLAFIAAGGLLAAGALLGRHAKSRALPSTRPDLLHPERRDSFGQGAPDEGERVVVREQDRGRRSHDELESG
jgi:hypothetical protein